MNDHALQLIPTWSYWKHVTYMTVIKFSDER